MIDVSVRCSDLEPADFSSDLSGHNHDMDNCSIRKGSRSTLLSWPALVY